jgi:hypothetical protein
MQWEEFFKASHCEEQGDDHLSPGEILKLAHELKNLSPEDQGVDKPLATLIVWIKFSQRNKKKAYLSIDDLSVTNMCLLPCVCLGLFWEPVFAASFP